MSALEKISNWERPIIQTPEVIEYFQQLHDNGILEEPPSFEYLEKLAQGNPRLKSLQTNSISLTTINAGVKMNVIPAGASATLDCRLVPGYDREKFMKELEDVINDPQVEITREFESSTPPSRMDTELYEIMVATAKDAVEDSIVLPSVSTGFTDSRVFRRRGTPAYGFVPFLLGAQEVGRGHGNDECVSIENLKLGMQVLHKTIRSICG